MWKVIDTGAGDAQGNMDFDRELLRTLDQSPHCILHFYEWKEPSITCGHFIQIENHLDLQAAKSMGFAIAKRPTGGGVVFHTDDLAFSVLIPASSPLFSLNTLENYAFVNDAVLGALKEFIPLEELELIEQDDERREPYQFCMARPTKYDVVIGGKKIGGAAQRKTKKGFLHQGTISLRMPCSTMMRKIVSPSVATAIEEVSFPLFKGEMGIEEYESKKKRVRSSLEKSLKSKQIG